jgi:hypothetical protein
MGDVMGDVMKHCPGQKARGISYCRESRTICSSPIILPVEWFILHLPRITRHLPTPYPQRNLRPKPQQPEPISSCSTFSLVINLFRKVHVTAQQAQTFFPALNIFDCIGKSTRSKNDYSKIILAPYCPIMRKINPKIDYFRTSDDSSSSFDSLSNLIYESSY